MKKKLLLALTVVFVLGLAMAAYALNQTNNPNKTASASCCSKSESCPLKNKNAQTAENHSEASCCDNADCCCKGDSCPMKVQGETGSSVCCDNCCGGSCPMKSKEAQITMIHASGANIASNESCPHKMAGR